MTSFPTIYEFACGAIVRREYGPDNRVSIAREHNVFHIKGFEHGKHFWLSHRYVSDAKATFSEIASRLRCASMYR